MVKPRLAGRLRRSFWFIPLPEMSPLSARHVAPKPPPFGAGFWQVGRCNQSGAVPKSRPRPISAAPNLGKNILDVPDPPWQAALSRLVSWWDMERFDADHFCALAAEMERQAAWYRNNAGKSSPGAIPTWNQFQTLQGKLDNLVVECKAIGLRDSADSITEFRNSFAPKWGPTYERVGWHLDEIAKGIQREMKRTLFLYVPQQRSELYESPLEKWQAVIERFSPTSTDIEEGCKCFALDRYAGAVFHMVRVTEHGIIEIGHVFDSKDPKPGWRSVRTLVDRIVDGTPFKQLTSFEQKHFPFLEQVRPLMIAMERAWRDKISHAANDLILLSGDFQPGVAEDIMNATLAFMRRLASDLPEKEKKEASP